MPRAKDVSSDLREVIFAAHQFGKDYRPFPNNVESILFQLERLFTSGKHSRLRPIFGMNI